MSDTDALIDRMFAASTQVELEAALTEARQHIQDPKTSEQDIQRVEALGEMLTMRLQAGRLG